MSSVVLPQSTVQSANSAFTHTYTQAGAGQTLLLIHGSLCDYRYWRWQIPTLSQHYHVVAPSLRGYWPNALQAESPLFRIEQHTQDMIEFIGLCGVGKPVHLLGHSRGAHIALEVACQAPQLVSSLTLADPGFRINNEPERTFQLNVVNKLREGDVEGALTDFIDTVNGAQTWRHMVSWFKQMVQDNAYTLLSQINESNLQFDVSRAKKVKCPTLLLNGANSAERYIRVSDALQPHFSHVERSTIMLSSHGMNLANPKAFNTRILEFLSTINALAL